MGPGFKYHVATIAAIFFALAVGLVVGSLTVSPRLVHGYEGALKGLRTTLNQDITEKSDQVSRYKTGLHAILPVALKHKLSNANVVVVVTGHYSDTLTSVDDALQMAGAHIVGAITMGEPMIGQGQELKDAITQLHSLYPAAPQTVAGIIARFGRALAYGDDPQTGIIAAMQKAGLVDTSNGGYDGTPAKYVVILGGSRGLHPDRVQDLDIPIIQDLKEINVRVVVGEPADAAQSDVPTYQAGNIDVTTVDDVDKPLGQFSLVYGLLGASNNYGEKQSAHALTPTPATPEQQSTVSQ